MVGDPRGVWPRERDFTRWLAGNLGALAACLGTPGLECLGREVTVGCRRVGVDSLGRPGVWGGLRVDLTARDGQGRLFVVETQIGEGDHDHMGKLITYAHAARADMAVWVVAGIHPVWIGEDLEALAELNERFAGHRQFFAVAVTLETPHSPVPLPPQTPQHTRLRRIDLASRTYTE